MPKIHLNEIFINEDEDFEIRDFNSKKHKKILKSTEEGRNEILKQKNWKRLDTSEIIK